VRSYYASKIMALAFLQRACHISLSDFIGYQDPNILPKGQDWGYQSVKVLLKPIGERSPSRAR